MESDSEFSDIILTNNNKRKRQIIDSENSDTDRDEIVLSVRKRCRIISDDSDDEEENGNKDCKEWIWKDTENNSEVWQYSRISGINIPVGENITALQMVNKILTEELWKILVIESNRYANQTMLDETRTLKKFEDNWRDINIDEIKTYFALCILMSQVKKSSVQSYWSKRSIIETPIFRKTMPFWRFVQLSRFLHFTNNEVVDKNDRMCKLRSIIDYLNEKFESIYTAEEYVSLDESLMKYKGRMSYKQYNPSKRARFGVKFYKLCESKSGYCIKFKIYTGQYTVKHVDASASENVVMFMSTPIAG